MILYSVSGLLIAAQQPIPIPINIFQGLNGPYGVAIDNLGNVYVSDYYNNRVVKLDATGVRQQVFTTTSPSLQQPNGVAVDNLGNVYIADFGNHRIVIFGPTGSTLPTEVPVSSKDKTGIIVGSVIAGITFLVLLGLGYYYRKRLCRRNNPETPAPIQDGPSINYNPLA